LTSVLLAAGCFSDPGYSVTVQNQTDLPIRFVVEGTDATPGSAMAEGKTLSPGIESVDHWLVPSGRPEDARKARIRARTLDGTQVYCKSFSFQDLKEVRFHIDIRSGVSECP
jgi:hypothetical protein